MISTHCEYMQWQGLPIIRKELVKSMINNFGLNQKEAAEKMGLTRGAVCQYLSRKRGKMSIVNSDILSEINVSAEKIIKHGTIEVSNEICRICGILRKQGILSFSGIK